MGLSFDFVGKMKNSNFCFSIFHFYLLIANRNYSSRERGVSDSNILLLFFNAFGPLCVMGLGFNILFYVP